MQYRALVPVLAVLLWTPQAFAKDNLLNLGKQALEAVGTQNGTSQSSTSSGSGSSVLGASLSDSQIASGLKDALRIGTEKAVSTVGKPGGFLKDSAVHIPLPPALDKLRSGFKMLKAVGLTDDLETRLNTAAETAAPKAAGIFADAVSKMTIDDARGILTGPQNSATQYFKRTTNTALLDALKPIIDQSLAEAGAVQAYNAVTSKAKSLPLASAFNLDLTDYVAGKALDGIYHYVAKQEADIRANPTARTTDALKALFQ